MPSPGKIKIILFLSIVFLLAGLSVFFIPAPEPAKGLSNDKYLAASCTAQYYCYQNQWRYRNKSCSVWILQTCASGCCTSSGCKAATSSNWSGWTDTSACSGSCGGGTGTKTQSRTCLGTVSCGGTNNCTGSSTQTVSCTNNSCCPVNGGWSATTCGDWSTCTRSCGTGTQSRTCSRTCTNPSPSCAGASCSGSSSWSESQYCNTQACCTDNGTTCNYSNSCDTTGNNNCGAEVSRCNRTTATSNSWGNWYNVPGSQCSVSCGGGTIPQWRDCLGTVSCGGTDNCGGQTRQSRDANCNTQVCPTNGSCGAAAATYACTASTFNVPFCSSPNQPLPSPSFPGPGNSVTWTCSGSNGGTNASCTATHSSCPVNGACGSAATTYSVVQSGFSGSFCSVGAANPSSPSFPGPGNSTTWTCSGSNGGTNASCTASRAPDAPSLSVSPSPVVAGGNATFSWNASNGATSYALRFYRDGAWDANYTWITTTSRAISTSGLNSVIGAYVWACSNATCSTNSNYASANIIFPVNGACGSAATTYPSNSGGWSGSYCSVGAPTPANPPFPAAGDSTTWTCSGSNGGSNASCRGSRAPVAVNLAVNNGRVVKGDNVVFSWNAVNGATSYGVKYYRDTAWDANYTWVYTTSSTVSTSNLNSVIGAYVWACSNYACGSSSNYAAASIVPASPDIPVLSVSPTQNIIPGQSALFSWTSVPWVTNYYIGYRRDGVWDTSWTLVGPETSVYFNTQNLTQTVGAEVIACHEFGCSARSNQAIATMLPKPAAPAITIATPPSILSSGSYKVYMGGQYNYVRWYWTAVSGITEYKVSLQKSGGSWEADFTVNKNTTQYSKTLDPDLRGVSKIAARVRACNQAGCGNYTTSPDITIILAPPSETQSVQTLSTSSNTNNTNLSSNSDPIYKAITNSSNTVSAIYRVEITSNSIGATFSIVDGTGNPIAQDVRSLNNEIYMKVPPSQTYYLKISGTNAGQVQYRFKRYNNYPPYQGQ